MDSKILRKQPNSKMCLVCGLKNLFGLKAFFYETDGKELVAVFTPSEEHQGYPGRLHGGIAAAVLDETIGRAILIDHSEEVWGVTIEFKARFRKLVPLTEELRIVGRITRESKRVFEGTGELLLQNGDIAATGVGKYLKMPLSSIADFDKDENEWRVVRSPQDPDRIRTKLS